MATSIESMRLKVIFLLYCIVTVCFTLYYSENFTDFTKYKGDEYIYYFGVVTGVTYFFIILSQTFGAKTNLANLIFVPLVILLLGIVIDMALLLFTTLEGTPKQTFYLHTAIHVLLSYLFGWLLWRKHLKESDNRFAQHQASQNGS